MKYEIYHISYEIIFHSGMIPKNDIIKYKKISYCYVSLLWFVIVVLVCYLYSYCVKRKLVRGWNERIYEHDSLTRLLTNLSQGGVGLVTENVIFFLSDES